MSDSLPLEPKAIAFEPFAKDLRWRLDYNHVAASSGGRTVKCPAYFQIDLSMVVDSVPLFLLACERDTDISMVQRMIEREILNLSKNDAISHPVRDSLLRDLHRICEELAGDDRIAHFGIDSKS